MLIPQLNAFIVAECPSDPEMTWGRITRMEVGPDFANIWVAIGAHEDFICRFPPWKLLHCHHQPIGYEDKKTKKWVPGADDTIEWRLTREAIARAMSFYNPEDKRPRELL